MVACSSQDTEFMALSDACCEVVFIQNLLNSISFHVNKMTLFGDNKGSLCLAKDPTDHQKSKHIAVHYFFIHQCVEEQQVQVLLACKQHYHHVAIGPAGLFSQRLAMFPSMIPIKDGSLAMALSGIDTNTTNACPSCAFMVCGCHECFVHVVTTPHDPSRHYHFFLPSKKVYWHCN